MENDCRVTLSAEEFDAIPNDDEYPIDEYFDKLIAGNEQLWVMAGKYPHNQDDPQFIEQLTTGQRLLLLLGIFDSQVKNGGITQFFWNRPRYIFTVRDAIEHLGDLELLKNYDAAVEALVGKKDQWLELREAWCSAEGEPQWEPFRQSYGLLDLSWFDNAYFDKYESNEAGEWTKTKSGLSRSIMKRLAEYVRSHKSEFIESKRG